MFPRDQLRAMEPPDPWASYLRQRGGGQASDDVRGSFAGRSEMFPDRASSRPGAGHEFGSLLPGACQPSGQTLQGDGLRGPGSWLGGQTPFAGASGVCGNPVPSQGARLGDPSSLTRAAFGVPQGRPSLWTPPTFLATAAPQGFGPQPGVQSGGGSADAATVGSFATSAQRPTSGSGPTAFAPTPCTSLPKASSHAPMDSAGPAFAATMSTSSPTTTMPGVANAAAAAASLDSPCQNVSDGVKVASAFEVLGMPSPANLQRPADQAERFIAALTQERRSIPTWQGQPGTLRTWLKLLAHWESETSVPKEKWGIRLYQSFQENSEPRKIADQVPLSDVLSPQGYGLILSSLMTKYKPYLDVAAPAAVDKFFYAGERQKGQTFASFIAAKEVARQDLENHLQERVPERIAGRVLLRQAHLTDWQRELVALKDTNQMFTFSQVISMLRPLDRPELIAQAANAELGATAAKHYPVMGMDQNHDGGGSVEETQDDDESFLYDEADEEETLEEDELLYEDREFDEDEAMYIRAYHSAYSDVRRDLQNRRKERGFIRHRGRGESKGRPKGKGRGRSFGASRQQPSRYNKMVRGSTDDLLSRTRCYNCKELGHYARDCPLKGSGKGSARTSAAAAPKQVSFVVCRGNVDQTVQHHFVQSHAAWPLMYATVSVKPTDALVDTAAEDAVVGDRAFAKMTNELAHHQLRPLWLREGQGPMPCAGIGGAASTVGQADVPTCVAGTLGVIRFTILQDTDAFQTPPLLPISYLEAVDAVIDLPRGQLLTASGRSVPMERLPSGHRSVPILDFHSTPWQLPAQLQVNGSDAFALTASDALQFSGVVESSFGDASSGIMSSTSLSASVPGPRSRKPTASSAASPESTTSPGPLFSDRPRTLKPTASAASPESTTSSGPYILNVSSSSASGVQCQEVSSSSASGVFNYPVSSSSASGTSKTKKDRARDAERLAGELLKEKIYDYQAVEELVSLLPVGKPSAMRGLLRQTETKSGVVTFGLYAHGPMQGITTSSYEMPNVCEYLNSWVSTIVPESFCWTSLSVGVQTSAFPHVDAHNEALSHNMSVTVGQFSKGELWLQATPKDLAEKRSKIVWREKGGRKLPGYLINTYRNPVFFSPKQCHATMSWSGFRVSITAFTARSVSHMSEDVHHQLSRLCFRCPVTEQSPKMHVLSEGDEPGPESSCVYDFEQAFEGRRMRPPRAAGMFKRMLSRAAVWIANSKGRVSTSNGQPPSSSAEDGSPGSRRFGGSSTHGNEEESGNVETTSGGTHDDARHGPQPDGGGLSHESRGARGDPRGDHPERSAAQGEEEGHKGTHGSGDRKTSEEIGGSQELSNEGCRVQPPAGCSAVQRQPDDEVVGVHSVRIKMEPSGGEGAGERGTADGDDQRICAETTRSSRPRVPSISTSPSRTPSTRCSNGDGTFSRPATDRSRDCDVVEHWSCAFFHKASRVKPGETSTTWTTTYAACKNTDKGRPPGDVRAQHGQRGLGRCSDDQPQRAGRPSRILLGGRQLERSHTAEMKTLESTLVRRGWLLGSILVLLSLSGESARSGLGTMFGVPQDHLYWEPGENRWDEFTPGKVFNRGQVHCRVYPREQIRRDWLADLDGLVCQLAEEDKKILLVGSTEIEASERGTKSSTELQRLVKRQGEDTALAMDMAAGWDFSQPSDRQESLRLLRLHRPALIVLSAGRDDGDNEMSPTRARSHAGFAVNLARMQIDSGRGFYMEYPKDKASVRVEPLEPLKNNDAVVAVSVNLNGLGWEFPGVAQPIIMLTNRPELLQAARKRCRSNPSEKPLESMGSSLGATAAKFVDVFLEGLRPHLRLRHFPMFLVKDRWFWQHGQLVCRHFMPRHHLCLPEECPFEVTKVKFTGKRATRQEHIGGHARLINDQWNTVGAVTSSSPWSGQTVFEVCPEVILPEAFCAVATRMARSAAHDFHEFQSEQHQLQAELSAFPTHRILEDARETRRRSSSTARASLEDLDWDDFLAEVEGVDGHFVKDDEPEYVQEMDREKGENEDELKVSRELREMNIGGPADRDVDLKSRVILAPDVRREIYRIHRNLGHPETRSFCRALKHAGVRQDIIRYVKTEFSCPICSRRRRPQPHRPAHLSREMGFNEVVGIDLVFFRKTILMNVLCWGTSYQWVEAIPDKRSETVTQAFMCSWVGHYGIPKLVVADQGREFTGQPFVDTLSDAGCIVHFIDTRAPWQNSRTEKAGGVFKEKLAKVIDEATVIDGEEMKIAISETLWTRNMYYDRSGYSPHQRVFGSTPRVPMSMLSDDMIDRELVLGGASDAMKRALDIRQQARKAWMEQQDQAAISRAAKANTRSADASPAKAGDVVYVWRETSEFRGWTGPGIVDPGSLSLRAPTEDLCG